MLGFHRGVSAKIELIFPTNQSYAHLTVAPFDRGVRRQRGEQALQEPPFKQDSHSCWYAEDEKKNWQLLGDRVTSSRDPDPHVDASDDEPERDVSDGRQARGIGIV
jgi:hypothetical protein